jgi:hypothetical protein
VLVLGTLIYPQETQRLLQAEELLSQMRHPDYTAQATGLSALEARLGGELRKRNARVGDIIREWDSNNE